MTRVVVLDYGSGNLRSAERALARTGADVTVTRDYAAALDADGLVVPGVGAYAACMRQLHAVRGGTLVWDRLRRQIGVLAGTVTRLEAPVVPHMGWNTVEVAEGSTLFAGVESERFYFVHSYAAREVPDVLTTTADHGGPFAAAVERGVLAATQFHPEKSGDAGAALLANWVRSLS